MLISQQMMVVLVDFRSMDFSTLTFELNLIYGLR
jgi:hypothetical protein